MPPSSKPPVIAVVTVNYRTADLVINSLQALARERVKLPGLHTVIVDNDSGDNSVETLKKAISDFQWADWVKVVAAPKNGGYAYGNNQGFAAAQAWLPMIDYYWMLNPDTEVLPGAAEALVSYLVQNPRVIAGSCLEDRDGTKQVSTFNFPSVISEMCSGFGLGILDKLFAQHLICRPIPTAVEQSDWMAGASLMFTSEVQTQLGNLDDKYFLYFEEVDYLLQAKRAGIHCWYIPESRIIHEVGAATGISDVRKRQPRRPKYWFESRRRYFTKNHGRLYLLWADLLWLTGYGLWVARKAVVRRDELAAQPPALWRDFFCASVLNPLNWSSTS